MADMWLKTTTAKIKQSNKNCLPIPDGFYGIDVIPFLAPFLWYALIPLFIINSIVNLFIKSDERETDQIRSFRYFFLFPEIIRGRIYWLRTLYKIQYRLPDWIDDSHGAYNLVRGGWKTVEVRKCL